MTIAVFGKSKASVDRELSVGGDIKFIYIGTVDAIRGRMFDGAIFLPGWYENRAVLEGYDELFIRQPNICKNIKRIQ